MIVKVCEQVTPRGSGTEREGEKERIQFLRGERGKLSVVNVI